MVANRWSIGRIGGNSDIELFGDTISSLHAWLQYDNGHFLIQDANSTNGTYLIRNQESIVVSDKFIKLFNQDRIVFGDREFSLEEIIAKIPHESSKNDVPKNPNLNIGENLEGKKIRCPDCMKPIFANKICPSCGSNEHIKGKN